MNFLDDPRRATIEPMHEFMQIWADFWRDKKRYEVSITYIACMAVRDFHKRVHDIREGYVIGQPIRIIRRDRAVIAERVRKIIHTPELWEGHKDERRILVTYYLKIHPSMPIGKIASMLDCKPWEVDKKVKDALYYLSTIWRD